MTKRIVLMQVTRQLLFGNKLTLYSVPIRQISTSTDTFNAMPSGDSGRIFLTNRSQTTPPMDFNEESEHHEDTTKEGRFSDMSHLKKQLDMEYFSMNYSSALETVDVIINKNNRSPDLPIFYYTKAMTLKNLNRMEDAVSFMIKAFTSETPLALEAEKQLLGYAMVADHFFHTGNYEMALSWQDSVIHYAQLNNLVSYQHFNRRSEILDHLDKVGEAIDDLKRSIDLQLEMNGSVKKKYRYMMALLKYKHFMKRKRVKEALMEIEDAILLSDKLDLNLITMKVDLLERMGLIKGAVSYLEQLQKNSSAAALYKMNAHILFKLAELEYKIHLYEESLDHLETINSEYKQNTSLSPEFWANVEQLRFVVKEAKKQHKQNNKA